MHEKKIQKFQNPGGGGIWGINPSTWNSGMGFSSDITGFQASSLLEKQALQEIKPLPKLDYLSPPTSVVNPPKLDVQGKIDTNSQLTEKPTTASAVDGGGGGDKAPFAATKAGKAMAIGSQVAGMASQFIPDKDKDVNQIDATMKKVRGTVQQGLMSSGNPWLMAVGAADMIIGKLGGHADASQGLGAGTDVANAVASFVPGAGWIAGKTEKYSQSEAIKSSSSYTGEVAAGEKAARNAGAKLLFGRGKANDIIRAQKRRDRMTEGVLSDAKDAFAASNYGGISMGNEAALEGGVKAAYVKQGAKLLEARRILKKAVPVVETVEVFREGGKVNVIPSGQLHKNKHHMEDVGDEYKDLTSKGIPVVTEGDGGELVQQAEIERDEIIFNIDVTRKLEELMKDGSDEAALKAGKLLATEIMENTVDNTGLMKKIS